jgi:hypothetical protein
MTADELWVASKRIRWRSYTAFPANGFRTVEQPDPFPAIGARNSQLTPFYITTTKRTWLGIGDTEERVVKEPNDGSEGHSKNRNGLAA